MRLYTFALLVTCLFSSSAFAEQYGSQTNVTLKGDYYFTGTTSTQTLSNGDTRDTETHTVVSVTNATILQAMKDRSLIPSTPGYQLVMVAHAHMADGVAWFATTNKGTPVPVPTDLLTLNVSDGPVNGTFVVDSNASLKSLKQETHNQATLTQGDFSGTGLLTQTWRAKSVKNGTVTEVVELVSSTANFTGPVTASPTAGVGTLDFKLSGAKTVDLADYGMASTTTVTSGGSGSLTKVGAGTFTLSGSNTYSGSTSVIGGTLSLGGSGGSLNLNIGNSNLTITGTTPDLSGFTFSSTSTVTINTTSGGSASGLVVDANGTITQLPTFGSSLPGTLIIITSSGTYTYIHDANGVWTLVTP